MRGSKRSPWLFGLGVLLAVLVVFGGHARADVTTDRSGTIIVFPKVVADGTRDTLIQMANTSNMATTALCTWVNAVGFCSGTTRTWCDVDHDCPSLEQCVNQCVQHNFEIDFTAQQPRSWLASTGNPDVIFGQPPLATGVPFVGELKCVQVEGPFSNVPLARNSLKGEATIFGVAAGPKFGQVSEYNAIAILGNPAALGTPTTLPNGDVVLNLNLAGTCAAGANAGLACSADTQAADCPGSTCTFNPTGEFNACPKSLVMNHYGEGAVDPFTGATVNTELTLVPCTEFLEGELQVPSTHAAAHFQITDELERSISFDTPFDCLLNRRLNSFQTLNFNSGVIGLFAKTRISPEPGNICYTGDNRCHSCTPNLDGTPDNDPQCASLRPGDRVGNCNCSAANPCVNYTGVGTCAASGANCQNNGDCLSPDTCTIAETFGCRPWPGLLGVAEEFQQPSAPGSVPGTAAVNLFVEGSRPGDVIVLPPWR